MQNLAQVHEANNLKTELTKNRLTLILSLDRRGFDWCRLITLLMVSSGWHSLVIEHHVGPVGNKLTRIPLAIITGKKLILQISIISLVNNDFQAF